ncbi:ATP-dependent RNA helicase DeaD [Dysgonomonas sp. PFB1-18]|uniref:DEAD/DEAH box helicase n=1 Tax=unclassified Dysgonomonas TaxID=2630389 RepID=UPI00247384CC|nr:MULTISPECIES: DEAD/DEAH box helicase [unclassified Dysgonomonas]MDH6310457.1 ATP-dependent RNA helicase DeaD [Dysgonomonas sp. PF1-14]MDH6340768.1 ATP-dependent RNA helicase DeaD [Dysgonomonas sp. PF1-16]MDH6382388.1 ATP-dependent RNA helicase DeaD [Dysgonomonas sp. PFB1-18]MDH6399711.1 ATP-dependent RNA helicase DeaD [Dysgonomonas sp. PF1-23]
MKTEEQTSAILSNLGIDHLNKMQVAAQKTIISKPNTLLLSPTGSGKTLAFLLPILQLLKEDVRTVQCLVVVPSRELALQIEQVWKKMGTKFKVNVCYGGHSIDTELKNLSNPPALLIGTPGRLTDHLERKSFDTDSIGILVLDEFDKSLQLGFQDEMNTIISQLPNLQKRILLSATSDVEIPQFVNIKSPTILDYVQEEKSEALSVKIVLSPEKDKIESLFQLLCSLNSEPALIFCNHREVSERISDLLNKKKILTGYYHGGMDQDDRERVLVQFRNGSLNYLVTTDLAARGLDIPEMKHVIHYHLPAKESEFIHRNGRTARMHASGTAYIIQFKDEKTPDYISEDLDILQLKAGKPLPNRPEYQTIYVSGGKKNKLNKSDIVGFFLQKGKLDKSDLGLIEVKDFISFVAVRSSVVKTLLMNIRDEKMKGKKYKIEVARNVIKKVD